MRDHADAHLKSPARTSEPSWTVEAPAIRLARLRAREFRNLEPLDWQPADGCQLILGDNGAGKTSLLEAVYVLATGRSLRTGQLADCPLHGSAGFQLRGEVEGERRAMLSMTWAHPASTRRSSKQRQSTQPDVPFLKPGLQRWVNGKSVPLAEYLSVLPVVAWTRDDAELLTGLPGLRRRLLDRGVVGLQPSAIAVLSRFRRALQQKREALQRGAAELDSWNQVLAAAGAELVRLRGRFVERLAGALETVFAGTTLQLPTVRLQYRPSPREGSADAEALLERLRRVEARERQRGMPLLGPHRDDLAVLWGGGEVAPQELKRTASAGERKAVGLAVLAAHGRVLSDAERPPLVLIDDADTELSAATLQALWPAFEQVPQLLASSNRPEVWQGVAVRARWQLQRGRLEAA